jgi:hypothetical protein
MALPRFSFSGGATDFFQPNQALFRTTFTPSDKLQSDTYQAEAKAYQDAVEKYNEAIKVNPEVAPPKPTPISFTQEEFDQFGVDASRRAQQLQNARQNAFNAISNPSGFSQQYGIGSLGFGDGGEVPFFLEAQPRKSNVPSPEELNEALLRYFPVLQLLNKTSKIFTKTIPDMAKTSVRMIKSPESKDEEFEQLQLRTKDQADSILNMFGTSTEKLIPRAKEPVYKTKFENGGAVPVNFVGTGEFPETESSVGYRTGPALQDKELPLVAELLADSIPVAGDIKAGIEAADYFNKGEYGNAALAGVGVLPFVPPLVGMTKKIKSLTLDALKRKPILQAPEGSNTFKELGIVDEGKYWRETNKVNNKPTSEQKSGLREQALKLESGEISKTDFRKYVDANIPYYFHDAVPIIRSPEEIASSLGKKSNETKVSGGLRKTGIIGFNRAIPEGKIVESRFDVPAYQNHNVYTATIHEAGSDVIGYGQSAALKNVDFTRKKGFESASLRQAKGNEKSPFVKMKGEWKNHSPEELRTLAVEALAQNKNIPLNQQEWVQVGINPAKGASWVALEKTADGVRTTPITGADEVIQIGKLVLARKPKLQSWESYYKTASFEDGGAVGAGIASLRPSETSMGLAPYGVRHSGEGLKGKGYFGEIQSPSGQSVTEYSLYDEDIGEYPSIVPTLTAEELQDTIRRSSQGEHPSVEVIIKARMYAKDRLSDGKSTFSGPTELRFPVPSNTDDDMIRRIDAYLEKNRP